MLLPQSACGCFWMRCWCVTKKPKHNNNCSLNRCTDFAGGWVCNPLLFLIKECTIATRTKHTHTPQGNQFSRKEAQQFSNGTRATTQRQRGTKNALTHGHAKRPTARATDRHGRTTTAARKQRKTVWESRVRGPPAYCFVAYSKEYSVNCLTCPFCPAFPY